MDLKWPLWGPGTSLHADFVWLATGTAMDAMSDPLLSSLQASCPTRIVGGYPALDDSTLAWPGLPLFLLGRSAMLSVGPAAGSFNILLCIPVQHCSSYSRMASIIMLPTDVLEIWCVVRSEYGSAEHCSRDACKQVR